MPEASAGPAPDVSGAGVASEPTARTLGIGAGSNAVTGSGPHKVGILYSSITGNNRRLVDSFVRELQAVSAEAFTIVIADICKDQKRRRADPGSYSYPNCDFYLVGTWADSFQPSTFVQDYLNGFPAEMAKGKPVAAFSVHGGNSGIVTAWILRCFAGKGAVPVEELNATFRSNWPTPFWPKGVDLTRSILKSEVEKVDAWTKNLAGIVRSVLLDGAEPVPCKQMSASNYAALKATIKIVQPSLLRAIGFRGALSSDPDVCIGCHRCEQACPYDAWTCQGGRVMLWDKEKCRGCLACTRVCPVNALRDGKGRPIIQRDLQFSEEYVEEKVRWRRPDGTGK